MWQTHIVYFKASGPQAAENVNDGIWVRAVADATAGQALVDDTAYQAEIVSLYGTGALKHTTSAVDIPHLAQPGRSYYNENTGVLSITRVLFPVRASLKTYHNRLEYLYSIAASDQIGVRHPEEHIRFVKSLLYGMHQAAYYVWNVSGWTLPQRVSWLTLQSLGPADSIRASVTVESGAESLILTLPTSLGLGTAGNDWELVVTRISGASSASIDTANNRINVSIANTVTFAGVETVLEGLTDISAGDVVVTGTDSNVFPTPATLNGTTTYEFSGGSFRYDRDDPETIADLVDDLTTEQFDAAVFGSASFVGIGDLSNMTRRTLADVVDPLNAITSTHASVAQLARGAWIDSVME